MSSPVKQLLPVVLCLCLCICAGCSTASKKKKQAAANAAAESQAHHRQVGTIVMVNEAQRFVLIDTASFAPAEDGTALKCFSNGKETGVLTLSPERRPPFMI